MAPFGRCLGRFLYDKELTYGMLAERLKIKPPYLSMILNGDYLSQPKDQFVNNVIKQ